jgi:hypothetical protein
VPNGRGRQPEGRGRTTRDRNNVVVTTTTGILRRVASNQLVIEADDHRIVWFRLSDKMPVHKDGQDVPLESLSLGDYISVDSTADDEGNFTATEVTWQKAATPASRQEVQRQWDLPRLPSGGLAPPSARSQPAITREPGDDRPILRRKNADPPKEEAKEQQPVPEEETAKGASPAAPDDDDDTDTRPPTAMRPADAPRDTDDSGPPVLRHGGPARRTAGVQTSTATPSTADSGPKLIRPSKTAPEQTSVARQPSDPILPGVDPVIEKAREAAAAYSGSLPNFFAQQFTARYEKEGRGSWQALDVVSADVAYEDGHESYKNIKIGNKATSKPMGEIGGTRSTGEFATLLDAVMQPGAGATFRKNGTDTIRSRSAYVYSFEIPRERSTWRVEAPSQLYFPAIRGSIWIDKETFRVLRIEQEGRNIPVLFPFDTVETAAEYDFVRLGTAGPFLLPVEAEVLSCQRGTSLCSRNKIEFRNYRKFGSESSITFDEPKEGNPDKQ